MKWVVVGGGSGGCVAARRLSDAGHAVTLVEAGPPLPADAVPAAIDGDDSFAALALPDRVYEGLTARRTTAGPETPYLRGRGVGGSSAVNAMVALRGRSSQYAAWGWSDVDAAWDRTLIPAERPPVAEFGRIDRMLLAAADDASVTPLTRRHGRRVTAAEAYLWPVLERATSRFGIRSESVVDRVEFDDAGAAVGVVLASGDREPADAVVLAAGAIHTPTVLQRSGVDRAGTGLRDHPAVGLLLRLRAGNATRLDPARRGLATASMIEREGIQILSLNHLGPDAPHDVAMLLVALMRPSGAGGSVRIRSDDPAVHPTVEFDLLAEPDDRTRLTAGVVQALDMLRQPPFADVVDAVYIDHLGTTADVLDSDAAIDRWISGRGADYVHASCSAASVVGSDGGVQGHEALYVCDASAFPGIPDVNTHLPTTMLAERVAARWPGVAGSWS